MCVRARSCVCERLRLWSRAGAERGLRQEGAPRCRCRRTRWRRSPPARSGARGRGARVSGAAVLACRVGCACVCGASERPENCAPHVSLRLRARARAGPCRPAHLADPHERDALRAQRTDAAARVSGQAGVTHVARALLSRTVTRRVARTLHTRRCAAAPRAATRHARPTRRGVYATLHSRPTAQHTQRDATQHTRTHALSRLCFRNHPRRYGLVNSSQVGIHAPLQQRGCIQDSELHGLAAAHEAADERDGV
jgi:hypothetical protein